MEHSPLMSLEDSKLSFLVHIKKANMPLFSPSSQQLPVTTECRSICGFSEDRESFHDFVTSVTVNLDLEL